MVTVIKHLSELSQTVIVSSDKNVEVLQDIITRLYELLTVSRAHHTYMLANVSSLNDMLQVSVFVSAFSVCLTDLCKSR